MRAPLLFAFLLACVVGNAQRIVTVAGLPPSHRADIDGKDALSAPLGNVYGLLADRVTGRLILHDQSLVERLEPDGTLLILAGSGPWQAGDVAAGTPASGLRISVLRGMAQDASGALYLADAGAGLVFRIARDGTSAIFAGGGPLAPGSASGGGTGTDAALASPRGLVFDSKGNLYIAEAICGCIWRVTPGGIFSSVYKLPAKPFHYFEGLGIDSQDNLFAAEYVGGQVLRIGVDGSVTTVAGTGVNGFSGDGGPATSAQLSGPSGVAVDASGNLYIADTHNHRIRMVTPDGNIATIAGAGAAGFSGDGGPAASAQLNNPAQVLVDPSGALLIADYLNGRVRRVSTDGTITTVAGNGSVNQPVPPAGSGEGGPALNATLTEAIAAAFDSAGNLYFAERMGNRIRKIAPDGTIRTVTGNGTYGYTGDGGPAVNATIYFPNTLTVDAQGSVYFASDDSRVRKIDPGGTISLVAGTGTGTGLNRSQGDGGPAVNATLNIPKGLAVDAAGNVFIADTSNARLRMVDRNGVIRTVAGPGQLGQDYWNAVAMDPAGKLYVAVTHTGAPGFWSEVDRVNSDGSLTTVAGNRDPQACGGGVLEFGYDGQPAANVPLCLIIGMTFDSHGVLYIPESRYGAVLRVTPDGAIARVAGSSRANLLGDGGPPLSASLAAGSYYSPASVAIDGSGNLLIPQSGANRIRKVTSETLALKLSSSRVDLPAGQSQKVAVTTNFGEPFPYLVRTQAADGGTWLSVNRSSGQTGEPLLVSTNAAGLAPGVYHGTVTVVLVVANGVQVDLPVSLTVQ